MVILDRTVYDNSILNIISDSTKFKKLKNDPTLLREGQLQRFLRNLKKNNEIDNIIYDKIYPSGSQPARIYGLPKMHKVQDHSSTPPFRPIVSSIGTYNYNLAKYLCTLLNPHIPNDYCAQDTFTFVSEVTRLHTLSEFMVSFDVESLFTNILKNINYSCSSYPTRASYSGQVDGFRNPMKPELKTRPCLKAVFQIIWNTDANFLNLHIDKATKTRGDKQLFNHTFYETNFKPKLFTANVECNVFAQNWQQRDISWWIFNNCHSAAVSW